MKSVLWFDEVFRTVEITLEIVLSESVDPSGVTQSPRPIPSPVLKKYVEKNKDSHLRAPYQLCPKKINWQGYWQDFCNVEVQHTARGTLIAIVMQGVGLPPTTRPPPISPQ